jgi:hypothetical protein
MFNPTDKANLYSVFVGKSSAAGAGSKCAAGKVYVIAGNAADSLLYQKVSMATPPCGDRMPLGYAALTAAESETVRAWIAGGALNN